jgi:hypothetical protein
MRKGLFSLALSIACVPRLLGQAPPPATVCPPQPCGPVCARPAVDCCACCECEDFRCWARAEYLLWWVKGPPIPFPLVTTGDPNTGFPGVNSAGAIDQPSTRVLFGGSNQSLDTFSGMRFTLGAWADSDQVFGVEGTGFVLERRASSFALASDAAGNPPLYLPAFNVQTQAERAVAISDPLRGFSGDVAVSSRLQLWGAELNGLVNLWRRSALDVSLLAGFRYADLKENFQLRNTTNDLLFFNTTVLNDHFDTRNQFYGGQVGSRLSWQGNRLSVDVTGTVALGGTHQIVNVQGDISQFGPGAFAPGKFAGGLFTQPTNIGRRSANDFTVLPAAGARLAYQVTPFLCLSVGYDFLYWNQVVRPGNQIDRNINQSQSPIFGGGALVGQAAPAPLFNRTDFWAHGVSVGVGARY